MVKPSRGLGMAINLSAVRNRIIALVESLPDDALADVVSFLEVQQAKSSGRLAAGPPYRPTPLGGLWQGLRMTEVDIAEARREMWGGSQTTHDERNERSSRRFPPE